MCLKMILFDLDGTLLPMDQDAFIKKYFGKNEISYCLYNQSVNCKRICSVFLSCSICNLVLLAIVSPTFYSCIWGVQVVHTPLLFHLLLKFRKNCVYLIKYINISYRLNCSRKFLFSKSSLCLVLVNRTK